ncbi:hypothetical protein CHS0354_038281 [Potamilus streckersoni]|uniref:Mitochondrial ATP synthase regulatory component factor B n=1 Tax=Potamilus streckersoni TaxID=2493646 RepID=A0AAE0TDS9_9BIVA|nr:hypothetical protein CHS0354_038281 [Potamilus streckersoni]
MASGIRLLQKVSRVTSQWNRTGHKILSRDADPCFIQRRHFLGWLNSVFNKVDDDRIKEVGPDRAAAEWLLRCGASVRWKGFNHIEKDYNSLPGGSFDRYKIEEIDASGSCIMFIGFPHLNGLNHVTKVILHECIYLEDNALEYLSYIKETLKVLQISRCPNITKDGLSKLVVLENLQQLVLFQLPEVIDKEETKHMLQNALPKCQVQFLENKKEKSQEENT